MKLILELEQQQTGVWMVYDPASNKRVIAPSPADAILPLLEALGLDQMAGHVIELRRTNEEMATQLELLKIDYRGMMSFINELRGRLKAIRHADDHEKDLLTQKLEKMIAPWPPRPLPLN